MDKNEWNVGHAKQQFSELLRQSEAEPQWIYRRNRLVAAVVRVEEKGQIPGTERKTIAERFSEAREIFRDEGYRMPQSARRSRRNEFVKVLDAVVGRHERSE